MRYTKEQKKKMVLALQKAKKKLRGEGHDGSSYICNALGDSYGAHMARTLVMTRLQPAGTVSQWLRQQKYIPYDSDNVNNEKLDEQVQAYRHRWVDELIRELSE